MKLHHFANPTPSAKDLKVQNIGRALGVQSIAESVKPAPKIENTQVDMDGDGDVDGMDAAIAAMTRDHKAAAHRVKHYD